MIPPAARTLAGFLLTLAALLAPARPAAAQLDDVDVILRIAGGRLQTGAVINSTESFPHRVFHATFGDSGIDDFINEPGFDSDPASSGLAPGSQVGFDFLGALKRWNGQNFASAAAPLVQATFATLSALSPLSDVPAPGLAVSVSAGGAYHIHFGWRLISTAQPPLSPADQGVYALQLQQWTSTPGVSPSLPYWIVFNQNSPAEEFQAAVAWLTAATSCPADVASLGGVPGPDGALTADDIVVFISAFFAADLAIADKAGLGGSSTPDGALTADDVVSFLASFFAGCP